MAKRVSLDVDSSIIEKKLLITEQDSCELDSLFPKQEENAILIKPLPVPIKMSDEVNLELKEQNNKNNNESDSNSSNLNTKIDNIVIENLELKNSIAKKVIDDNSTNNDNISDNTDSNNPNPILIKEDNVKLDNVENTSTFNSTGPIPDNVESVLNNKQEVDEHVMVIGDEKTAAIQMENTGNQNEETHDEIDITLEYDDVEDQLLNDGPGEESAIPEEKSETKINEPNSQNADEKDTATANVETTKIVENNDNPDKQNQAPLGRCLWVSGLSHTTRANDLKQHFVSQGRVIGAKVVSNSRSPGARCYGYIVMSTPEEADACVKNLHHSKLLNRFISVQKAKSDKQSDNNGNGNESTDVSPHKNVDSNVIKSKKIEDEKASDTGDIINNEEPLKSESNISIDKKKKDTIDGSPKRLHKGIESSDKKYPKDSNKRRRDSKERHSSKKTSHDNKDKKVDKYQRLREERERERRINEERRIREVQRRQREEAARLDRERQMLRIERERLQREKMELLRLEKEQLEKEREELKRQKQKIEEASRKKHESGRSERIKKRRERSRSPLNRRSPDIPIKLSKKRELEKYKEPDRHFGSIDKHKDLNKYKEPASKDAYRSGYKDRHDFEYNRPIDTKYDRYPPEKKDGNYKPRDMDMKTDDFIKNTNFSSKRNDDVGFEPPPPRISTNEANHFSVLPMSHTTYGGNSSNNRMLRDDFHNKDMFMPNMPSSRNVDRVSDRFPIERHDRLPNENIDMNHRSRSYMPEMDCFPKQETSRMVPPVRQDRLDRDNIRVNREDRHMDSMPIRSNAGRYSEHERDFHHRDQWYLDRMGPSKRMMPPAMPARGDGMLNRASWESARYDQSIRPPGVYSSSIDRKIDRH